MVAVFVGDVYGLEKDSRYNINVSAGASELVTVGVVNDKRLPLLVYGSFEEFLRDWRPPQNGI